jgi:hypothetical protein
LRSAQCNRVSTSALVVQQDDGKYLGGGDDERVVHHVVDSGARVTKLSVRELKQWDKQIVALASEIVPGEFFKEVVLFFGSILGVALRIELVEVDTAQLLRDGRVLQ